MGSTFPKINTLKKNLSQTELQARLNSPLRVAEKLNEFDLVGSLEALNSSLGIFFLSQPCHQHFCLGNRLAKNTTRVIEQAIVKQ